MAPKGGKGFRQEWDEIEEINNDLVDLKEALETAAKRYVGGADAGPEHFGSERLNAGNNAGEGFRKAVEAITEGLDDAIAYLGAFTVKTTSAIETHQKADRAAEDEYIKTAKGV
ncbi:hypothetical protein [Thermocrispum sp.]|jgi:hypothetical protein|uniref:PE domain-containing protein n=1 Tax=Thermocrispum agreste TaxID=37925 RepID=A0ABD6FFK6_9PSEU|nr:hypothetical protein [Thermocrispum sp.]